MFLIFQEEKTITICMLVFLGISILIRVLLGMAYQGMIKETDNMATTENRLLKQCKVKFTNCYKLNNGVANIPVFVDKFLNRMAVGPISFGTLYHLSGQAQLLSVVSAGFGICKSIMAGRMLGEILPFYIASFAGLYLYFSVSTVVDIKGRRRILKVNLVDYLENHLSARIQVTEQDIEMLYGKEACGNGIYPEGNLGSTGQKTRSRENGIRTVELMPIGGHIAVTEGKTAENPAGSPAGNSAEKPAGNLAGTPAGNPAGGAMAVTAEELEALLQEFLTV